MTKQMPEGYTYEPTPSAFPEHVCKLYRKHVAVADGEDEFWTAVLIEDVHVNSWGFAHGGFMAHLSECATASAAYVDGGPPVVAIELSTYFLRAPKLGEILEIRARATRRTRSLVFVEAHAFIGDEIQFTATAVNKVVGA